MDNNIGSFGAILGGGTPIAQAMARRGMNVSPMNQVSPASPNFQQAMPGGAMAPQPQLAPQPQAVPGQANPETQMILQALSERLKHHSSVEKARSRGIGG